MTESILVLPLHLQWLCIQLPWMIERRLVVSWRSKTPGWVQDKLQTLQLIDGRRGILPNLHLSMHSTQLNLIFEWICLAAVYPVCIAELVLQQPSVCLSVVARTDMFY
jgi:hypothetical protein